MNLPQFSIKNSSFVFIVIIIVVLLGLWSFLKMPRAEYPQINLPVYIIVIQYPGTNPIDLEQLIVDPLEEVINEMDDIDRISSVIKEGSVIMDVFADFHIDADMKLDELLRVIAPVRETLPKGITSFEVLPYKPIELTSIYQFAFSSETASYQELVSYGEDFKKELKQIKGIRKIDIEAYPEKEVSVSLNFQKMSQLNISFQKIINALSTNNVNLPGGNVTAGNKVFSIITSGGYNSIEEIKKTVITASDNQIIYLQDIANIALQEEEKSWIARFNKKHAIWLSIKMKEGTNILQIAEKIKKIESIFSQKLPPTITLGTAFEQPPAVKKTIDSFGENLFQGMILVGLVILIFVGWRAALVIISIIPLCFLIGLTLLNLSGFTLQVVSVIGLILALGLVVDNGIVVIESIDGLLKSGLPPKEAAAKGTSKVIYAISSATITTILAFYPLTLLGGGAGEFLKSLPIIITLCLIASLLLAVTLTPVLASQLMKQKQLNKPRFIDRSIDWIVLNIYRPFLNLCLRFGWAFLGLTIILLVYSVSLFPKIGVSLLPPAGKPLILIDIEAPEGTGIEGTEKVVNEVEALLDTITYVKNFSTNIGHDNPQIYHNRFPKYKNSKGQILVNFKYWNTDKFHKTVNHLRSRFKKIPNAKVTVSELKFNAGKAPIAFIVNGENLDTLKRIASQIEHVITSTSGVINIDNSLGLNKIDLAIKLDRKKAGLAHISTAHFDQVVRASLNGLRLGNILLGDGKAYPLMIKAPLNSPSKITDLDKVSFQSPLGESIPFRQIADVRFRGSPANISHDNLKRQALISADVINSDQAIPIANKIYDELLSLQLPAGYAIVRDGASQEQQEIFGDLGIIFIVILIGIFAVLVFQFNSLLQPFIIFSAIPLAMSGSFIALYFTGWPFSLFAFLGFISLSGIVVNDSILIVDQINHFRAEGMNRLEAIKLGSEKRFLPVVLTTMTTIIGLVPLAFSQSNLWSPICATIIGGMISATVMILFVVPVLYKWSTKKQRPMEIG